jgi:hypothetical protein
MANPLTSQIPLLKGQQLSVTTMELLIDSDLCISSLPPVKRKYTFGMLTLLSSEKSDFGMCTMFSLKPEDESDKHALCSTWPKNDFCMNAHFTKASMRFGHARDTLIFAKTKG